MSVRSTSRSATVALSLLSLVSLSCVGGNSRCSRSGGNTCGTIAIRGEGGADGTVNQDDAGVGVDRADAWVLPSDGAVAIEEDAGFAPDASPPQNSGTPDSGARDTGGGSNPADAGMSGATVVTTRSGGGSFTIRAIDRVGRYDVFEMTIDHNQSGYRNVWEDADFVAAFDLPGGRTVRVDGFYYEMNTWKVRFAPWEIGAHRWTVSIGSDQAAGTLTVTPSNNKGFVRTHPQNPHRLIYETDGSAYQALGFSTCWWNPCVRNRQLPNASCDDFVLPERRGNSLTEYLDAMVGETGINLVRWSTPNCSTFGFFRSIDDSANVYDEVYGKWGDYYMTALRARGVRLYVDPVGFSWRQNERPGMDLQQRAGLKRYWRYVIARFGAYVDFWELVNEHSLGGIGQPWVVEMANEVKRLDPYGHMVAVSYAHPDIAEIDISAPHVFASLNYMDADTRTRDHVLNGHSNEIFPKAMHRKPIIWGETGERWGGPTFSALSQKTTKVKAWVTLFYEAYPVFWEFNWNPQGNCCVYYDRELRGYFGARQKVAALFDVDARPPASSTATGTGGSGIRVHELRGSSDVYLYVFNPSGDPPPRVTDASVQVDVPANGRATWYDTTTGNAIQSMMVQAGRRSLDVPDFTMDVVLVVDGD